MAALLNRFVVAFFLIVAAPYAAGDCLTLDKLHQIPEGPTTYQYRGETYWCSKGKRISPPKTAPHPSQDIFDRTIAEDFTIGGSGGSLRSSFRD